MADQGVEVARKVESARRSGNASRIARAIDRQNCYQRVVGKRTMMRKLAAQAGAGGRKRLAQWRDNRRRLSQAELYSRCK